MTLSSPLPKKSLALQNWVTIILTNKRGCGLNKYRRKCRKRSKLSRNDRQIRPKRIDRTIAAKRKVAEARAEHYQNLYDRLQMREEETDIYRLTKAPKKAAQDIEHYMCVKDKDGKQLQDKQEILQQCSIISMRSPTLN
ncbi:hypothetical protein E2320_003755 [Naja naja]|nr:hypothetical protein E2320_003755 [Naja naja]